MQRAPQQKTDGKRDHTRTRRLPLSGPRTAPRLSVPFLLSFNSHMPITTPQSQQFGGYSLRLTYWPVSLMSWVDSNDASCPLLVIRIPTTLQQACRTERHHHAAPLPPLWTPSEEPWRQGLGQGRQGTLLSGRPVCQLEVSLLLESRPLCCQICYNTCQWLYPHTLHIPSHS